MFGYDGPTWAAVLLLAMIVILAAGAWRERSLPLPPVLPRPYDWKEDGL